MAHFRTAASVAALLAGLTGLVYWLSRPEPVAVKVAAVELGRVAKTVANTRAGSIKACRRSFLAPATAGQIALLPVREGDRVERGQLLLAVWNDDLEAKLALAQAETEAARSRREEACVRAEVAAREARRLEKLRQQNLVSEDQLDRAQSESLAQAATCRAAEAALKVSVAQVRVNEAALAQTRLLAPFAGIVAEVNGEIGEYITPSPPGIPTLPAVDLIDDTCLRVSAPIDEVDAPGVHAGLPACVSVDALPDRICRGRVRRIAPYVLDRERQARTVEVEVDFERPEDAADLLVGYSADVEIELDAQERTLRIPTEAVLEGYRVLVFPADDRVLAEREFEPGLSNWEYTEVLSGLRRGERVVISLGRDGVEAGASAVLEQE
jgi:HlyD family secretion protein